MSTAIEYFDKEAGLKTLTDGAMKFINKGSQATRDTVKKSENIARSDYGNVGKYNSMMRKTKSPVDYNALKKTRKTLGETAMKSRTAADYNKAHAGIGGVAKSIDEGATSARNAYRKSKRSIAAKTLTFVPRKISKSFRSVGKDIFGDNTRTPKILGSKNGI